MATNSVLTKSYPSLTAVCHATAKAAPCGLDAKSVAQFMGKPYQTLMSELSRQEGHKFGADLVLPLMDVTGSDAPLHFLARELGGVYVSLPPAPHCDHPVHQQCMKTVAEFGLLMEETAEAMLDGSISRDERDAITLKGHEAITQIMTLIKVVSDGVTP